MWVIGSKGLRWVDHYGDKESCEVPIDDYFYKSEIDNNAKKKEMDTLPINDSFSIPELISFILGLILGFGSLILFLLMVLGVEMW